MTALNAKRAYVAVLLLFGLAIGIVSALGVQTLGNLERGRQIGAAVKNSSQRLEKVQNILSLVQDAETGVRGYLLTQDPAFLAPYLSAESRLDAEWSRLNHAFGRDAQRLGNLKSLIGTRRSLLRDIVQRDFMISADEVRLGAIAGKKAMDSIRVLTV